MAGFEPWTRERGAEIIAKESGREGATLPILHALQDAFGYIHADSVPMVAEALNLTRAEVHGVVSFYHDFRRTPPRPAPLPGRGVPVSRRRFAGGARASAAGRRLA